MKYGILFLICCVSFLAGQAQFKDDNKKYQTVFIEDLCETLKNHPDYVLLDVRSPGEYADTSTSGYLNIGHLKKAINIDINELDKRLGEIRNVSTKPVFIYCSHSQRSRRASTLLADSGFSRVFNINGGLTTFNLLKESGIPCASQYYETNNPYPFLPPPSLVRFLKTEKNVFILDIRKDSVFRSISNDEALNAYGKLNQAVNIPLSLLSGSLAQVPTDKKIVIVDDAGNDAPKAAKILLDAGYKDLSLAFNGMSYWNSLPLSELPEKNKYWTSPATYQLITADEFDELAKNNKETIVVDVRLAEEFENRSKDTWRNRGNIKNAVNIPYTEFANRLSELEAHKNKPIVLHHFSSHRDAFQAARLLKEKGFTRVHVLVGGLWSLLWRGSNIKGKESLKAWVENIPEENR